MVLELTSSLKLDDVILKEGLVMGVVTTKMRV